MTNTICGHDRNDLFVWLRVANEIPGITPAAGCECKACLVRNAVLDPIKLAAMMAEEGRRCGLDIGDAPPAERRAMNVCHGVAFVTIVEWSSHESRHMTMLQARAILAKLLQLPDGARDEAERVLRGTA